MANVVLPARTQVDLYDATGITVGLQIEVLNMTANDVRLASTVAEPTVSDDHIPLAKDRGIARNDPGDVGAWAMSVAGSAVDVREVL